MRTAPPLLGALLLINLLFVIAPSSPIQLIAPLIYWVAILFSKVHPSIVPPFPLQDIAPLFAACPFLKIRFFKVTLSALINNIVPSLFPSKVAPLPSKVRLFLIVSE